jgi:hypothetical protein
MAWRISEIQDIEIARGIPVSPGFVKQQEGRSPSLTITFENRKTAENVRS